MIFHGKKMSGRWGERPLGRGMEDRVIRSQSGFSGRSAALASSKTTNRSRLTAVPLQKTKTTPDYVLSLCSTIFLVDSSLVSLSPVLPAPCAFAILVRKYFPRNTAVRDSESPFRDVRSIPAASPCLHSIMKRAPAPATPPVVVALPGGSSFLSPLLRAVHAARLPFFHGAPVPRAPIPQRCGSSSADGLAPPLLVRRATAGRLPALARTGPRAAPGQPRFPGPVPAAGEADGWRRSAAGRRSRMFPRPQDVWT